MLKTRRFKPCSFDAEHWDSFAMYLAPLLAIFIVINSSPSSAQQKPLPDVGVKLSDDIATVRKFYKIDYAPEPYGSDLKDSKSESKSFYTLRTRGLTVFFSTRGKVERIRLEPPYSGSVNGIALGDSAGRILSLHGTPLPKSRMYVPGTYVYPLDDRAYVRYQIDEHGVQMIYIEN
jgi:hypothetical protein